MTASVLLYVQHLLGIGHVKRSLRVAKALAEEGIEVTLVSGGEPLGEEIGAVFKRVIQLMPVRASDATFKNLVGPSGRPIDESLRAVGRVNSTPATGILMTPPPFTIRRPARLTQSYKA